MPSRIRYSACVLSGIMNVGRSAFERRWRIQAPSCIMPAGGPSSVTATHLDHEADIGVVHATGGDVAGEHDALQGRRQALVYDSDLKSCPVPFAYPPAQATGSRCPGCFRVATGWGRTLLPARKASEALVRADWLLREWISSTGRPMASKNSE